MELNFSREIIQHLNKIQESITSYRAWQSKSEIFELIKKNKFVPSWKDIRSPLFFENSNEDTDLDDEEMERMKKLMNATRNLFNNSEEINSRNLEVKSDDSVNMSKSITPLIFFMRKLYYLASTRLFSLCNFLKMNPNVRSRCWACLNYVITKCHLLFENHYLDQIYMCCVYAVGRSISLNWSFNEILKWYRTQEFSIPEAYKHVGIFPIYLQNGNIETESPKEYGDLITYYNRVFLNPVNKFLYQLKDKNDPESSEFGSLSILKNSYKFKPILLSAKCKVYVSPNKISDHQNLKWIEVYKFPPSPNRDPESIICDESLVSTPIKRKSSSPPKDTVNHMVSPAKKI